MHYLALCCIARDEDLFLKEWITYHSLLGVEHFYIYDHCSNTPISGLLSDFADSARVTVRRIQGEAMQIPAYDDCLQVFGPQCRWIGFLDVDEFAYPMHDNDLRVTLSEFERYGGLAATWHVFQSSGHLSRPRGLVLENYTEAAKRQDAFLVKCFVDPARAVGVTGPHTFIYADGSWCVNEEHFPMSPDTQCTFASGSLLRVHHYFTRSQQDFEEKLRRGHRGTAGAEYDYKMDYFYNIGSQIGVEDKKIWRFLPQLKTAMQSGELPGVFTGFSETLPFEQLMEAAMDFYSAGHTDKAQVCLCRAAIAHAGKADLWTLRAMLAQACGNLGRARIFLERSLLAEGTVTGLRQLKRFFAAVGREREAEAVDVMYDRYPEFFH